MIRIQAAFRVSVVAGLLSLLCFSGAILCNGQSTQGPPTTEPSQKGDQKAPEKPPISPGGSSVDTHTFKVGPEDILNIVVWKEPQFSGNYTVHTDGKFTMPLVGDVQAGGLTPVEIEPLVTQSLSKLLVKPLVTVTVAAVYSRKYYLDGEITRPGEYPLQGPTTVLDAISKAGGLRDFANPKKIYILRGDKRILFNWKDVIHGKNMEQNIQIEAGDHIVFP
jgi:polysaccharide export outer membrane protein